VSSMRSASMLVMLVLQSIYMHQINMGSRPVFVNYKKAVLDSQPQMLKLTNCLPMVGGSLRVLQLLAHLRMVAMI
jgi:hypothetical protein